MWYWLIGVLGYFLSALCAWVSMSEQHAPNPGGVSSIEPYPSVVPIFVGPLLIQVVLFAVGALLLFLIRRNAWTSHLGKSFAWAGGLVFGLYLVILMQQ